MHHELLVEHIYIQVVWIKICRVKEIGSSYTSKLNEYNTQHPPSIWVYIL